MRIYRSDKPLNKQKKKRKKPSYFFGNEGFSPSFLECSRDVFQFPRALRGKVLGGTLPRDREIEKGGLQRGGAGGGVKTKQNKTKQNKTNK